MDVHKTSTETSTPGISRNFSGLPRASRAVKGGEAEAPDVSAPTLEGPGSHPDHNGGGRPGHRPAWMLISWLATGRSPASRASAGSGAGGVLTGASVKQFWRSSWW